MGFLDFLSPVTNLIGGWMSGEQSEENVHKQAQYQKQFAQQGIRWRVADARKAGLHPLAALGANTMSYSPVSVGGQGLGTGLARAGQDITRAISNKQTANEKALMALQLEKAAGDVKEKNISNQILQHQLDQLKSPPMPDGPGSPTDYPVPDVPNYMKSSHQTMSKSVGTATGVEPYYKDYIDENGFIWKEWSKDLAESRDGNVVAQVRAAWHELKKMGQATLARLPFGYKKKFAAQLRKVRPKSRHPDYEYRFNLSVGRWRHVRRFGKSQLFDSPDNIPRTMKKSH